MHKAEKEILDKKLIEMELNNKENVKELYTNILEHKTKIEEYEINNLSLNKLINDKELDNEKLLQN